MNEKEIRDMVALMSLDEMGVIREEGFVGSSEVANLMLLFANVVARRAVREALGLTQEGGEEDV